MDNGNGVKHRAATVNVIFSELRTRNEHSHSAASSDGTGPANDSPTEPLFARSAVNDNAGAKAEVVHPGSSQISALIHGPLAARDQSPGSRVVRQPAGKLEPVATSVEAKRVGAAGSVKHWFDELKINFLARHNDNVKSVLFLGMSRGAGASMAALNFARSLAEDIDARVLLINADFRDPAAAREITDYGLTNLVESPNLVPAPGVHGQLHMVPSGGGYADPAVLFQSKRFRTFMAQCKQQYDYIIVDGPPLDEAPESIALCTNVDGVILVLDARHTHRRIALRAKSRIEQAGGKILGVTLNRRRFYIPNWLYKLIY